jgi:hypothetical protein
MGTTVVIQVLTREPSNPPRLARKAWDSPKVLQIPGYNGEAVLEGCCTDPDVFDPDWCTFGLQRCEQIPGTKRFGLTQREDLDTAQNLTGNSFPQARTVGNTGCPMAKLGDADH